MKISETIQLYEFIGKLGIPGFIGLIVVIFLVVLISNLAVINNFELSDSRKFLYSMLSALIVLISIIILKLDADNRLRTLNLANTLKSELINKNWKVIGFNRIYNNLGAEYNEKTLNEIIQSYPTEFIEISDLVGEERGIKLIDNEAVTRIDAQLKTFAPYLKSQLIDHMKFNKLTTMGYDEISKLDLRFDTDLIDITISMFPDELIPINLERKDYDIKGVKLSSK